MKTKTLWTLAVCGIMTIPAFTAAAAQETVVVEESETIVSQVPCKTHYYTNKGDNWFIQVGAGVTSPFVENKMPDGVDARHHLTTVYNVG
ncbi:MAG: hypothetical protein K2M00_08620, partial [Muribaculaceae bacterium]|nr:hypothetical protein [Muribaculaceae bacterium]